MSYSVVAVAADAGEGVEWAGGDDARMESVGSWLARVRRSHFRRRRLAAATRHSHVKVCLLTYFRSIGTCAQGPVPISYWHCVPAFHCALSFVLSLLVFTEMLCTTVWSLGGLRG